MAPFPVTDFVVFMLDSPVVYGTAYYFTARIICWSVDEVLHRWLLSLY